MTRLVLDPIPGSDSESALRGERLQLVDGTIADRVGGATEGLFLVAARSPPFEQRGDAVECLHRIHHPEGSSAGSVPERECSRVHSLRNTEG